MNKAAKETKKFLEEQIEWCKRQDTILKNIENKLYEMRELAEYAGDYQLSLTETNVVNEQFNTLKQEVYLLEQQLQSILH